MLGLRDRVDAPLGDRTEALQRRTMLVGWTAALLALAAAFYSLRSLTLAWSWLQRALGQDAPALHIPGGSSGTMLSWLALGLLAAAVFGLSTGRLRRRYAWLSLALMPAVALVDFHTCDTDVNPVFIVPSRIERAVLSGDLDRADKLVTDTYRGRQPPEQAYVRAQIALRNRDASQAQQLFQPWRAPIEYYSYRVSQDPAAAYGQNQMFGHFRPQVLYAIDRLVYGQAVLGPALEYERIHHLKRGGWRALLGSTTPILLMLSLGVLCALLFRTWRSMRRNYLSILDHQQA